MEPITGIILAGGKSSRMGTDKGLMRLDDKPMIQHILDPLTKICQRILIVTGNPTYGMFGAELVSDEEPDYGPVMGILSGLKQSSTERNLILSCDAPFVTFELLEELVLNSNKAEVVVAHSKIGIHPLIAGYKRSVIPVFEDAVKEGEHRLKTVLKRLNVCELRVQDEELLKNLNIQADVKA